MATIKDKAHDELSDIIWSVIQLRRKVDESSKFIGFVNQLGLIWQLLEKAEKILQEVQE